MSSSSISMLVGVSFSLIACPLKRKRTTSINRPYKKKNVIHYWHYEFQRKRKTAHVFQTIQKRASLISEWVLTARTQYAFIIHLFKKMCVYSVLTFLSLAILMDLFCRYHLVSKSRDELTTKFFKCWFQFFFDLQKHKLISSHPNSLPRFSWTKEKKQFNSMCGDIMSIDIHCIVYVCSSKRFKKFFEQKIKWINNFFFILCVLTKWRVVKNNEW